MRKIVCITISILLLLLSGCNGSNTSVPSSSAENVSSKNVAPVKDEITIYCFEREELYKLLEEPSFETLQTLEFEAFNYPDNGEGHYKHSGYVLKVDKEFRDFINVSSNMEKFLAERGIQETVRRSTVFETIDTSLVILVETEKNIYFIKLTDFVNGENVQYYLYTKEDFLKKFQIVEADIMIDGKLVTLTNKARIIDNKAEVPFIETAKAMGAEFEWKSDLFAIMTLNGHRFELSLENHYTIKEEGDTVNLFRLFSVYRLYRVGNEVYVPAYSVVKVMDVTGSWYYIKTDKENQMIYFDKDRG